MPSGQTFESDLRAVREARGLSLGDIHQQTRIPVDVLRRFEEGVLLEDPTFNEVYLKAFMQSYAKAIGVPPSAVHVAYEDQRAGAYRGALHPDRPAESPPTAPPPAKAPTSPTEGAAGEVASSRPPVRPPAAPSAAAAPSRPPSAKAPAPTAAPSSEPPASEDEGAPPAVVALRNTPDPEKTRVASTPPKTLAEARVNRPVVPSANRSFDKNWTTILGLFVVALVLMGGALYVLVFAGDDEPEAPDELVEAGPPPTETVAPEATAATGPPFQLPIRAVLTAGGDGLQSFRVTVDDEGRRPYWIEIGQSETFEADSLLILWGEDPSGDFSEATVEIQGLRFTPAGGQPLQIDARTGQRLLDSLAAAPPTPTP